MNRPPDDKACCWVRDRLPLMADAEAEPDPRSAPSAPGPDERAAVVAHLEHCQGCRARRDDLGRAMDALSLAVAAPPRTTSGSSSLWPALQARIDAQARSKSKRNPLDRAASRLTAVRDDLPLQRAWLEDSARERLEAGLDPVRVAAAADRWLQPLAGPVGVVAAAALLIATLGIVESRRSETDAQARIAAAAAPTVPAVQAIPLVLTPALVGEVENIEAERTAPLVLDDRTLAQNTDPPLRDPEGRDLNVDRPIVSPPPPPPAVHFDLDRGVPMPPASRVGKPAY